MKVTDRPSKWPYATSPRPEALVAYYNDEGTPSFKTFSLRRDHFRGLDAIPQLVQEGSVNGEWKPIGLDLWNRIDTPVLEELAVTIRDRGTYFASNKSNAIESSFTQHRDLFVRDMGQSLHKLDDTQGYHYVRTQLLLESISKELVFYPLSILIALVSGAQFDYIPSRGASEGYEFKVLRALKAYKSLKYYDDGIKLGKTMLIRRGSVSDWIDLAQDLVGDSFGEKKGRQVIVMEQTSMDLEALKKLRTSKDAELYIIVRLPYLGPLDPSLITRLASLGFQYRGVHVYNVSKVRQLKYPIWYFSRIIVDLTFPPIFKVTWKNNEETLFPPESTWEVPTRSLQASSLRTIPLGANSMTYYGATNVLAGQVDPEDFAVTREGEENVFLPLLLPSTYRPRAGKTRTYANDEEASISQIYHNRQSNTTLILYRGGFGQVRETYTVKEGWSISWKEDTMWFLHSTTARSISRALWKILGEMQGSSYTSLVGSIPSDNRMLTYYSLAKYWNEMRISETPTLLEWEGETYQHSTAKENTKLSVLSVGTVNGFGIFAPYSIPVQTLSSIPAPFYPLPATHVNALYRESRGSLIVYRSLEVAVVVSVRNGLIDFPNPFLLGEMPTAEEEDGLYEARLVDSQWIIEGPSSAIVSHSFDELLAYYLEKNVYSMEDSDTEAPIPQPLVTVWGPLHAEGDLSLLEARGPMSVSPGENKKELVLAFARASDPRDLFVADEPHEYSVTLGSLKLSSPTPLLSETRYTAIYATEEQLAALAIGRSHTLSIVPKRTLVASSQIVEGVTTDFYTEEEEQELLVSVSIESVQLSWRAPYEAGMEEEYSGLDSETLFSVAVGLYPIVLSSSTVEGRNVLKKILLQALFG